MRVFVEMRFIVTRVILFRCSLISCDFSNLKVITATAAAYKMADASYATTPKDDNIGKGNGAPTNMELEEKSDFVEVAEGKARIRCDKKLNIFYNAPQEVNRDIR